VESGQTIYICAVYNSIIELSAQGTLSGICVSNVCVDITPTPTVSLTQSLTPTISPSNESNCECITFFTYDKFVTISGITCAGATILNVNYPANSEFTNCWRKGTFLTYGGFENETIVITGGTCVSSLGCSPPTRPTRTPTPTPTNTPTQLTPTPTNTQTPTNTITPTVTQTLLTPTPTPTNTSTPVTPTPSPTFVAALPFVSTWNASTIELPYDASGNYTGTIDWGDGSVSANTYANRTHSYSGSGPWTIIIDGQVEGFNFGNYPSQATNITSVTQWGQLQGLGGDFSTMFKDCINLDLTSVSDILNMSTATITLSMFEGCTTLTNVGGMNSWNMSSVNDMTLMFRNATSFNEDISVWDTGIVSLFSGMFQGSSSFNQNIGGWNVSSATDMVNMFRDSISFDQDLSSWDVSNVVDMTNMLNNTLISISNYESLLVGWDSLTLQSGVTFGVLGLTYNKSSAGDVARDNIITNYSWTFVGDSEI
jgi:surface protein